jgi:hypothetical protein
MNLLILACSQTKRPDPGLLPALERYDGPLYRVLRRWMRANPDDERLALRILSAEYGLIGPRAEISDYNRRMTPARAALLRPDVTTHLGLLARYLPGIRAVFVNVGTDYRTALPDPLPFAAVQWASGGIGQRQQQMKHWLEGLP